MNKKNPNCYRVDWHSKKFSREARMMNMNICSSRFFRMMINYPLFHFLEQLTRYFPSFSFEHFNTNPEGKVSTVYSNLESYGR